MEAVVFLRCPGPSLGHLRVDGTGHVSKHQPAGPLQRALRGDGGLQRQRGIGDFDYSRALSGPVTSALTFGCLPALGISCAFCLGCSRCKRSPETGPGSDDPSPTATPSLPGRHLARRPGAGFITQAPASQQSRARGAGTGRRTGSYWRLVSSHVDWGDYPKGRMCPHLGDTGLVEKPGRLCTPSLDFS